VSDGSAGQGVVVLGVVLAVDDANAHAARDAGECSTSA
jgi:hypothetical protein